MGFWPQLESYHSYHHTNSSKSRPALHGNLFYGSASGTHALASDRTHKDRPECQRCYGLSKERSNREKRHTATSVILVPSETFGTPPKETAMCTFLLSKSPAIVFRECSVCSMPKRKYLICIPHSRAHRR